MKFWGKLKRIPHRGFKRDKFRVVTRRGMNYLVNYKNSIDRKLIVDGGYEDEQLAYFSSLVIKYQCARFYDIGANIGLYSLNISKLSCVEKTIAFEPVIANICQLKANLLLNNLHHDVEVLPFGLSDKEDTMAFLENVGNSTGRSRIKETNRNELDGEKFLEKNIQVKRLDSLAFDEGLSIAIKMDIEGHETRALKGMLALLKRNSCVLQVEAYGDNGVAVDKLLAECGYVLEKKIGVDHYYLPKQG